VAAEGGTCPTGAFKAQRIAAVTESCDTSCFAALTEEQIVECEEEAAEIAGAEVRQEEAAELLVKLYARMIVRNIRAERNDDEL
jgi:hypothetical protein